MMNRSGTQLDYFFVLHVMSTPLQRPNPNMCLTHPNYYKRIFQVTLPAGLLQLISHVDLQLHLYLFYLWFVFCDQVTYVPSQKAGCRPDDVIVRLSLHLLSVCLCLSGEAINTITVLLSGQWCTHTHKETHTAHTRQQQKP